MLGQFTQLEQYFSSRINYYTLPGFMALILEIAPNQNMLSSPSRTSTYQDQIQI